VSDFDRLWIWREPRIAGALSWYRAVATDRMPAKFRIAATIPASVDPEAADEAELAAELERLTPRFLDRWRDIREGSEELGPPAAGASLLEVCRTLAERMLERCTFCRWECRVDRSRPDGRTGACRLAAESRVSCAFHHPGEELVFRGLEGSGTIFFTSCNMRCAFCQNGDISADSRAGEPVSARELAALAFVLRREGCHNINWVGGEPAVHLHAIVGAIALLGRGFQPDAADRARIEPLLADRRQDWPERAVCGRGVFDGGFNAPILWNSNMYLGERPLRLLRLLVDVWLPDFKFGPGRCAIRLARTPHDFETVTRALRMLAEWGEDLLVRHLVMPAHVECCTKPVLDWLAAHMPDVPVNLMDQYRPDMFAEPGSPLFRDEYREIARRPTAGELAAAFDHARRLGLCFEETSFEKHRLFA
jgi:putative pyruvate formate lyase activating enzyme